MMPSKSLLVVSLRSKMTKRSEGSDTVRKVSEPYITTFRSIFSHTMVVLEVSCFFLLLQELLSRLHTHQLGAFLTWSMS